MWCIYVVINSKSHSCWQNLLLPQKVISTFQKISFKHRRYRRDTAEIFLTWQTCLSPGGKKSLIWKGKGKERKGRDVWPSMVTHTRNLSSAFNPSAVRSEQTHTHTPWTHTRSSGHPFMLRRPGSSWGFGALLKGLTSVVVLRVERALDIHSPHLQSVPDLRLEPATFGLQVRLSIQPRLPTTCWSHLVYASLRCSPSQVNHLDKCWNTLYNQWNRPARSGLS